MRSKHGALISIALAILTVLGFLLPQVDFAENLQSPSGDNPAILWAVGAPNVESANLWMRAIFTFGKDGKPGTLRIGISRPPRAPDVFMRDLRLHVFNGAGTEIPFVAAWPDKIPLCGASGCGYAEANAFFKSTVNGAGSQLPKRARVTYKNSIYNFEFKD